MSRRIGMDPERVEGLLARLGAQHARLDAASATVRDSARASRAPLAWGIAPGELVIAPYGIARAEQAVARIAAAREALDRLGGTLLAQAAEQRDASAAGAGAGGTGTSPGSGTAPGTGLPDLPDWLVNDYYGAFAVLGYGASIAVPFFRDPNAARQWQFARQQWVNHRTSPHFRYRIGLVQWQGSTYRNNPVRFVYRQPQVPASWLAAGSRVPAWVGGAARVAGPVGAAVSGVTAGYDAWNQQWEESAHLPEGERQARAAAAAGTVGVTTGAGALGGAWAGAAIGATIGSIFPGPGTVIGGVVGGIIGGIAGSELGEGIGNWFNDLW